MKITTLGIDIAKRSFHLLGAGTRGQVVLRRKLTRKRLAQFIANLPPCVIGMEACAGAHYWARKFESFGHEVKLMHPTFVKPYVKTNKNDFNDAEGVLEAVQRPTMRFVSINTVEQQDVQAVHRVRQRLIKQRTAILNQVRGILHEYGVVMAQGVATVRRQVPALLENAENELSDTVRRIIAGCYEELCGVESNIKAIEAHLSAVFQSRERCQRLAQIKGCGPLISTALEAAVGDARQFKNGRQLAAWLGLVPRQNSSGDKTVLLGISKRGDRYVRTLLIQGAIE